MRALLCLCLLAPMAARADDGAAAAEAFRKGDYAAAARGYTALVERNPASADLWYNLGTAEARLGRAGYAIRAFEQAILLRPGDDDAAHNLEKVREVVLEKVVKGSGDGKVLAPGEDDMGTGLIMAMSPLLLSLIFAVTWVALFGLLIIWRRAERPALRTTASFVALIMGLLATASGGIILGRIYVLGSTDHGVVLTRSTVRAGPGPDYARGITLLEGVRVRMRGVDGKWRQVTLPDGSEGWLPTRSVAELTQP